MLVLFYKIDSQKEPVDFLVKKIEKWLAAGKKVLWLVPGGSAMGIVVKVLKLLKTPDLSNLTITLTDERYGDVGHPDSNSYLLQQKGLQLNGAKFIPVLAGGDIEQTTVNFDKVLDTELRTNDHKIGLFGMGADGHTAGIKPSSPAASSLRLAEYFTGDDFERITMTPTGIGRLDEAVLFCVGVEKHPQIKNLSNDIEVVTQPAQALKQVLKLAIFNDYKGEVYENSR